MNYRLIALAGFVGIAALLVTWFTMKPHSSSPIAEPSAGVGSLPSTDQPIPRSVAFSFLSGATLHYLDLETGRFGSYDIASKRAQSQGRYPADPIAVIWSPDGSHALITTGEGELGSVTVTDGSVSRLHPQIFAPGWSANSQRLLYQFIDTQTGASTLTIANADGMNWQGLAASPNPFTGLWWSPLGTYAIGINGTSSDVQYSLIAISSKTITVLAPGNPLSAQLKWSPSGKLALLDGKDAGTVNVAAVESGKVEPIPVHSEVKLLTWESEDSLVGVVTDSTGAQRMSRITLKDKRVSTLADSAESSTITQVIGLYNNQLIVARIDAIALIPLGN